MRRPNKHQLPKLIQAAAIANAGIVPYVSDSHKCNSCGNKLYHHPTTGYCFICDRDDWQETKDWDNPRIPFKIWVAINDLLNRFPEWLTKEGAACMCVEATHLLLGELGYNPVDDGLFADEPNLVGGGPYNDENGQYLCDHYYAAIPHQGKTICIDLTARQFDEKADCPKIWIE